ncbi:MAG: organoarsenical effux MFS transporter ArsJ [Halioglobus sp.]|nr:organoarsenical effux MFS transporter ArsJ [Halioglobus sp.]
MHDRAAMRQYLLITGNYWVFTLTDGALRMLVVLHFHQLGYGPLDIALLFLFYEFFGVVTNLVGGWLGARFGLNRTMNAGLGLQIVALGMLLVPPALLTVGWVMAAQALSGIAKDLNKMSAKSSVKLLLPEHAQGRLYKLVALLTGSKNALKGMGFFLGAALLAAVGFRGAMLVMILGLAIVWCASLLLLVADLGRSAGGAPFHRLFSKSAPINVLSAARMFLFGARDVWFVVALPVHLSTAFDWPHMQVGAFFAAWIIGYGAVQSLAPRVTGGAGRLPDGTTAVRWVALLALIPAVIALSPGADTFPGTEVFLGLPVPELWLLGGLLLFGVVFAINSSLHSYLIVSYADRDAVSLDVGFYYMANAMGRLLGTVLSGWVYQVYGLSSCLVLSSGFLITAAALSLLLPGVGRRGRIFVNKATL